MALERISANRHNPPCQSFPPTFMLSFPPFLLSSSMPFIFLFSSFVFLFHASFCRGPMKSTGNYEIKQIRIVNLNLSPPLGFIGPVGSSLGLCGGGMTNSQNVDDTSGKVSAAIFPRVVVVATIFMMARGDKWQLENWGKTVIHTVISCWFCKGKDS